MSIEQADPFVIKSIFCTSKGCIMNIEPLVSFAANLMESASKTGEIKLHLCYYDGRLQCLPVTHTIHRHVILFAFRAEDWPKGLHAQEWDQIRHEISKLTKELESCLTNLNKSAPPTQNPSKT